jgi:hypothetical protein
MRYAVSFWDFVAQVGGRPSDRQVPLPLAGRASRSGARAAPARRGAARSSSSVEGRARAIRLARSRGVRSRDVVPHGRLLFPRTCKASRDRPAARRRNRCKARRSRRRGRNGRIAAVALATAGFRRTSSSTRRTRGATSRRCSGDRAADLLLKRYLWFLERGELSADPSHIPLVVRRAPPPPGERGQPPHRMAQTRAQARLHVRGSGPDRSEFFLRRASTEGVRGAWLAIRSRSRSASSRA